MRLLLACLAFLTIGAASPAPNVDWTKAVVRSPMGGFLIGNPAAKIRLVEYMSYTCPHCQHFATESAVPLMRDHIAKGTVSFEVRNFLLNGLDFTFALAARCGGTAKFKGNHDAIFANQQALMAKGTKFNPAPYAKNPSAGMKAWGRASGLFELMAKRGVPAAALDKCIGDTAEQGRIQAMTRDAVNVRKLSGTPSFFINDQPLDGNTWGSVEFDLQQAEKS
ncbi:MAG: thioredoxin domain-containing protein [Sphingomonadales bacterium]